MRHDPDSQGLGRHPALHTLSIGLNLHLGHLPLHRGHSQTMLSQPERRRTIRYVWHGLGDDNSLHKMESYSSLAAELSSCKCLERHDDERNLPSDLEIAFPWLLCKVCGDKETAEGGGCSERGRG